MVTGSELTRMLKLTSTFKRFVFLFSLDLHEYIIVQAFHLSKGLHATWDQLADLGPTIPILRPLKTQFTRILGAPWQGTTHTDPDVTPLLHRVASKAKDLELHIRKPKRITKKRTVDILAKGREELQKKGMKAFSKRWAAWIRGTGMVEDDEDEIPVISSDVLVEL